MEMLIGGEVTDRRRRIFQTFTTGDHRTNNFPLNDEFISISLWHATINC